MSLLVNVRVYDESGKYEDIKINKGRDLAGFESSRYKLYGSVLAESLGIKLLAELKYNDLYVGNEKLGQLENELNIILERIKQFSEDSEFEEEYIKERVGNILDAVQMAKNLKGIVVIW